MRSYQLSLILVFLFHLVCYESKLYSRRNLKDLDITQGLVQTCEKSDSTKKPTIKTLKIPLHNLRLLDNRPDIKTSGFTYVLREFPSESSDFDPSSNKLKDALRKDALDLIAELTKSKVVFCYSSNTRGLDQTLGSGKPYRATHSDMSLQGAIFNKSPLLMQKLQVLKDRHPSTSSDHDGENARVVIFNVWRPLRKVYRDPLAICDWQTVSDGDAIHSNTEVTSAKDAAQIWGYTQHQKWYYLPEQELNEVFVFVQHDSAAKNDHGMNVPHASPQLSDIPEDAPQRVSYEFRIAAIVGNEFMLHHEH